MIIIIIPKFSIGAKFIDYYKHYNCLGLTRSSTGHLNEAVNELREKAKNKFKCVIEPIALYASEVWS